ncbi:LysR family transcriptional regulator, partial [Bacteriovoracaceae bacterium]|nr:LysR family transcriptional regulator [Bacteriovoracaceae bacterium]
MRISIDHIKQFQAVVRYGNLNMAAQKISISPSAISRSIKIIEEDLGHLLFNREGRNIILNQEGQRFYHRSKELLNNYENLYDLSFTESLSGIYRVGASHWIASTILPAKLDKFAQSHPQLSFEIYSQNTDSSILKVLSGDLDFALSFSPKKHSRLESKIIHRGQLFLCANKKHPLITAKPNKLINEIQNYDSIIHKANELVFSCDNHAMFLQYNIEPKFKYFWDSDFTAIELLKNNKSYWSILP